MENKQTAVEKFIEQLEEQGESWENVSIGRIQISIKVEDYLDLIKQAKTMEKSQMINFTDDYVDNCVIPNENMAIPTKMDVPEYYEEVYGNEDDLPDWDVTLNDGLTDEE
jgi:hypothetical protein